jgi:beta-lactamase regulating signal transducer with metallopeptidase domain
VLTAQYFIWYLALLPLIAGRLRPGLDQIRSLDSNDSSITSTISNENGSSIGSSTTAQVVASALGTWVFKVEFSLPVLQILSAFGLVVAVALVTGLTGSRGIATHPPLAILRRES